MSVLSPALAKRDELPNIYVGTSVGAINAAFLASSSHLPAKELVNSGIDRWREVNKGRVLRPILFRQAPLTFIRYAGEIFSLPGVRLPSLLDPTPLAGNIRHWIDWPQVRRNIADGTVDTVAAVATASRSGRPVVFVEGHAERVMHHSHAIDYVQTDLTEEHVRASAAIPILFPPVRVEKPAEARGWYVDGGTRLNTPIKPALDLGAERIVVIATDSIAEATKQPGRHESEPPDFGDGALHVLQGMLVDPVVEDMRTLGNINMFYAGGQEVTGSSGGTRASDPKGTKRSRAGDGVRPARKHRSGLPRASAAARRYREARGKPPYRQIPYIFIAPAKHGAIGRLATEVFRSRYGGWKGLRSPDFPFLNRLLGGDSPTHGELLSYLFFDPEFVEELIRMGQRDARRWLKAAPGPEQPWQVEPLDAFTRAAGVRVPVPLRATGR
jgi:NTE family protein